MNPVNLKVTLLSAAISTLILAACSSQSPEPEADRVRQQRAVSLVPAPRQDSDPVLPDRPASEAIRVEPRVDEVAVTGARVASSQAQGAAVASYDMASPGYVQPAFVQPPWAKHAPLVPGQGERYDTLADNGVISTRVEPLSTFSIDVDTGSYSNVRRFLDNGQLPPVDAVRTEEVAVEFQGVKLIGFVTGEAARVGAPSGAVVEVSAQERLLTVYLPMSYQVGGYLIYVPESRCEVLDMSAQEAMQVVLTANIVSNNESR